MPDTQQIINDFSITVATKNGSGSQTSNLTILRALFKMGIPVSGKNIFPSNIQGEPTWYTIRVNKQGFVARSEHQHMLVAMNPASFQKDLQKLEKDGVLFCADHINLPIDREDIIVYKFPAMEIAKNSGASPKLKDYVANMVYVGVLADILEIDIDEIEKALLFHFHGKNSSVDLNMGVVLKGAEWSRENLTKNDSYLVERMDKTTDMILLDGNTAGALGTIFGGFQFSSWYPITPATGLPEALTGLAPRFRHTIESQGEQKNTYAIVQAEDELAAIGMAVGAGWAGLRSMTATSGPGLSLMTEFIGLAYFIEAPVVIWNVQRVGPSTGLPTRTAQGDLIMTYTLGHGDSNHPILLPSSIEECFEFGWKAFDYAERLQTPVFVLSDKDLGMNQWMSQQFEYPETPMDRGKVLWEDDLEAFLQKWGDWARYRDYDQDAITYRTLVGNQHSKAAYFSRGTGHSEDARLSEEPEDWERNMDRLKQKFRNAAKLLPPPVLKKMEGARVGIIGFGSTEAAIDEARHRLVEQGILSDFLRIRSVPFNGDVRAFVEYFDVIYVVENNRDGQLHQMLSLAYCDICSRLVSLAKLDGLPLSVEWIRDQITEKELRHG